MSVGKWQMKVRRWSGAEIRKTEKGVFKPCERVCFSGEVGDQPMLKNAKFGTFHFAFLQQS